MQTDNSKTDYACLFLGRMPLVNFKHKFWSEMKTYAIVFMALYFMEQRHAISMNMFVHIYERGRISILGTRNFLIFDELNIYA